MTNPRRSASRRSAPTSRKASRVPGQRSRLRRIQSHRRRHLPLWMELPLLLLVAFCAAVLLRTFAFQSFDIPSGSMQQTLAIGDRVEVNKLVYQLREPQRGEVVVFKGTDRWTSEVPPVPEGNAVKDTARMLGDLVGIASPGEKDFVKRIIGTPGDTVACCDTRGRVNVNGEALNDDAFVYDNSPLELSDSPCHSRQFGPIKVPKGNVFVMGDHRGNSKDSRCQGFVPMENFIGRAFTIVWPKSHWTSLEIPDCFAKIPDPESYNGVTTTNTPGDAETGLIAPLLVTTALTGMYRKRRSDGASIFDDTSHVHSWSD